jgi:hypothetical protein
VSELTNIGTEAFHIPKLMASPFVF